MSNRGTTADDTDNELTLNSKVHGLACCFADLVGRTAGVQAAVSSRHTLEHQRLGAEDDPRRHVLVHLLVLRKSGYEVG